jgi:hypothetical protein
MLVAFRWVVFRALLLPPAGISAAGRVHRSSDMCSWRVQILRAKAEPVESGEPVKSSLDHVALERALEREGCLVFQTERVPA